MLSQTHPQSPFNPPQLKLKCNLGYTTLLDVFQIFADKIQSNPSCHAVSIYIHPLDSYGMTRRSIWVHSSFKDQRHLYTSFRFLRNDKKEYMGSFFF